MIPTVWLACVYGISKIGASNTLDYVNSNKKRIYAAISLTFLASVLIPPLAVLAYSLLKNKFIIFGINSTTDFLHSRNFRLILSVSVLLFLSGCAWLYIHLLCLRASKKAQPLFVLNRSLLVLFYTTISTALLFLALNPSHWVFVESIKQTGFQIAKSTMGTSFNPGFKRPIFDPAALAWFKTLFDNLI